MRRSDLVLLCVVLAACGDGAATPSCTDAPATCRARCGYGAGDHAAQTLDDVPAKIPIDHFILVMQENRTFDHLYSSLTVPGQTVDGAAPDATNPDPTNAGGVISRFHQAAYCFDNPAESWSEVHREVNGGAMDGFTRENGTDAADPTGSRAMGYYDETDVPFYYALSRAFAISDRHFASVQANSWTNRAFYMAATSYGITKNVIPNQFDGGGNRYPNLFTRLDAAKVDWVFYVQDLPTLAILSETWGDNGARIKPYAQFAADAAAGKLPAVTLVEGSDLKGGVSPDEDPPGDVQIGQQFVADAYAAVTTSPLWPSSALIITYDEQGGFYDHVPPPQACKPDDIAPQLDPGDVDAQYDAYGLRVPLIIVSPYAKRGYVSHHVTDHTSILRLLEARFDLPALTHRDANAEPPLDMFDFTAPNMSVPTLPAADVDAVQRDACAQKYPPH